MLKDITEDWKCLVAIVMAAGMLCGAAIGVDNRYAKAADLKQMQQAQNYSNFQMRLAALKELCKTKPCSQDTKATMAWLESQIKLIEREMGK